jgi:hypothetical protein
MATNTDPLASLYASPSPGAPQCPGLGKCVSLESVKKLHVEPGDCLIFTMPEPMTMEEVSRTKKILKNSFPNIPCLLLPHGFDVAQVKWNAYVESLADATQETQTSEP